MTTTEELQRALRAVEPGWAVLDVAALRERALRKRRNRRLLTGVAGCAAALAVTLAVPLLGTHLPGQHAQVALPGDTASSAVPRTVPEARAHTELTRRTAALPTVSKPGPKVALGWEGREVYLAPPLTGVVPGAASGRAAICEIGPGAPAPSCENLSALAETGWLYLARRGGTGVSKAPVLGVLRKPVASVVAGTDNDLPVPVTIRDLGQGYVLTVVKPVPGPVRLWAFDDKSRLIARA